MIGNRLLKGEVWNKWSRRSDPLFRMCLRLAAINMVSSPLMAAFSTRRCIIYYVEPFYFPLIMLLVWRSSNCLRVRTCPVFFFHPVFVLNFYGSFMRPFFFPAVLWSLLYTKVSEANWLTAKLFPPLSFGLVATSTLDFYSGFLTTLSENILFKLFWVRVVLNEIFE